MRVVDRRLKREEDHMKGPVGVHMRGQGVVHTKGLVGGRMQLKQKDYIHTFKKKFQKSKILLIQ
jgi:hypothetical protein